MPNDGDLQAVQPRQGNNAPPPPAPDAQKKAKANADLFKAIEGSAISRKARRKIYENSNDISKAIKNLPPRTGTPSPITDKDGKEVLKPDEKFTGDFGDLSALPDDLLEKWRLFDASVFFENGKEGDGQAAQNRSAKGKMARAVNAVIHKNRAKRQAEAAEAEETRLALKVAIASDIALELEKARKDAETTGDDHIRFSNARRRYLELASGLFMAGRYQQGFEQLENARTLRVLADLDAAVREEKGDEARAGENKRAAPKVEQARSHPLQQQFDDIHARRAELATRGARILKLYEVSLDAEEDAEGKPLSDSAKKTKLQPLKDLVENGLKAVPGFTLLEEVPAPTDTQKAHDAFEKVLEAHRASLSAWTKILDLHEQKLKPYDGIGVQKVEALHKALLKRLGSLAHLDDGAAERESANVDGKGLIAMHSKSKHVPQEVVRRIATQVEALEYIAQNPNMTAEQYKAALQLGDEAEKGITFAKANREIYAKLTKTLDKIEAAIKSDDFDYRRRRKGEHEKALEDLRARVSVGLDQDGDGNKDTPEKLLADAEKHLAAVLGSLERAGERAFEFKSLLLHYEVARDEAVARQAELLRQLAKLPGGKDEVGEVGKKTKRLEKMFAAYGDIANRFNAEWAKIDRGDSQTYAPTRAAVDVLAASVKTELDQLEAAVKAVRTAIKDKSGDTKDLGEWLLANAGNGGDEALIRQALEGTNDAEAEKKRIDALKASFDDTRKEMRKYIRANMGNFTLDPRVIIRDRKMRGKVEADMRQAFDNYNFLLDALKARGKIAQTEEEWKDLEREMQAAAAKIKSFAEDHRPPTKKEKEKGEKDLAATVIDNACRELLSFRMDVGMLIARLLGREKDAADAAATANAADADAKAVFDILDQREGVLRAFGDRVAAIADTAMLKPLAQEVRDAGSDDEKIALRERALAELRRKRLFLEESANGVLYRANPVDMGASALALAISLSAAEAKLLTLLKRG